MQSRLSLRKLGFKRFVAQKLPAIVSFCTTDLVQLVFWRRQPNSDKPEKKRDFKATCIQQLGYEREDLIADSGTSALLSGVVSGGELRNVKT